jgi:hypothetical protein
MAGKLIIVHAPIDPENLPGSRLGGSAAKRAGVFGRAIVLTPTGFHRTVS